MNKDIFVRCLISEKIKLAAPKINKQYRQTILEELKNKVEGLCTKHGYIKIGSIELVSIQSGQVEMASLNGNVIFDVKFYAEVCNPTIGNVIKGKVTNINTFGILAEVKPVLEIIIAKNSVTYKSDIDLSSVQVGQDVLVEVVGKKYDLFDKRICIIGRIISSPQETKFKKSTKTMASAVNVDIEDDEAIDDDELGDDDQESSKNSESEEEEEATEEEPVGLSDEEDDVTTEKIGGGEFFESDDENYELFGEDELSGSEDAADSDGVDSEEY